MPESGPQLFNRKVPGIFRGAFFLLQPLHSVILSKTGEGTMIRLTMAALLALLGSTLLPQSAKADVLEWRMRSGRQYAGMRMLHRAHAR